MEAEDKKKDIKLEQTEKDAAKKKNLKKKLVVKMVQSQQGLVIGKKKGLLQTFKLFIHPIINKIIYNSRIGQSGCIT